MIINNTQFMKCESLFKMKMIIRDVYDICVGFDGVGILKHLNQSKNEMLNDHQIEIHGMRNLNKIKMNYWMRNKETHCLMKYLCMK